MNNINFHAGEIIALAVVIVMIAVAWIVTRAANSFVSNSEQVSKDVGSMKVEGARVLERVDNLCERIDDHIAADDRRFEAVHGRIDAMHGLPPRRRPNPGTASS